MKIKTQDLSGLALNWAVAKCEFDELAALNIQFPAQAKHYPEVSPSTNWSQGGPIIERERIELRYDRTGRWANAWLASTLKRMLGGPTPLIAAMRCFVASELGDEVDIPEELLK